MYTPGLTISLSEEITRERELPVSGDVCVELGQEVAPNDCVLRAELPGEVEVLRLARQMGLEPIDLAEQVQFEIGSEIKKGDLIASVKTFFGLFTSEFHSPVSGVVEFFNEENCHLGVRLPSTPLEVNAYISGIISQKEDGKSVGITSKGAFAQGIFGVGGERQGEILLLDVERQTQIKAETLSKLGEDLSGRILVGGSNFTLEALQFATDAGAVGVVTGSITAETLRDFLGYEIGVSITGDEDISLSLIISEGFGELALGERLYGLAKTCNGKAASINGKTQVRAGAMRPELFVPDLASFSSLSTGGKSDIDQTVESLEDLILKVGSPIRIIRVPYFGSLGEVSELPEEREVIDSGAKVRVLRARLESGEEVTVPRANVELV